MSRLLIVLSNIYDRNKLIDRFPEALFFEGAKDKDTFKKFQEDSSSILVCTKSFAVTGFTVPEDTIILVGKNIVGADYEQIMGRVNRKSLLKNTDRF